MTSTKNTRPTEIDFFSKERNGKAPMLSLPDDEPLFSSKKRKHSDDINVYCPSPPSLRLGSLNRPSIPFVPPVPSFSRDDQKRVPGTSPLTIFYDGKMTVFEVSEGQAMNIINMTERQRRATVNESLFSDHQRLLLSFSKDSKLPFKLKSGLRRFMGK